MNKPELLHATAMRILPLSPASPPVETALLAQRRLRESRYFFLRNLSCRFDDGILTLVGCVPSGQLRQVAEAMVARIAGVREVDNLIEVVDPAELELQFTAHNTKLLAGSLRMPHAWKAFCAA